MSESQFKLLAQRRFAGLFYTQFLGAFNDNVFKQALVLIFVFSGLVTAESTNLFVNLAAGLMILPFFLFSATAGQIADKYEKSYLVRIIKLAEIVIAFAGGLAVYSQNIYAMLAVLFALGVQSAFFGPLKYSILPAQLEESELVDGNAQVEMGTFVAILLGTIVGGTVAAQQEVNLLLTVVVGAVAILGYLASRFIPECPPTDPDLQIQWNPVTQTWRLIQMARSNRLIYLCVLGISWFWLFGSLVLAQIPNLTRLHLHGDASVVTLVLSIFAVAVAVGSLTCARLSDNKIELGIVPLGAFGLSIAGLDLYFAIGALEASATWEWIGFLTAPGAWRVMLDMAGVGFSGGLFIVPLYALIQARAEPSQRARMIAVVNIMNAAFMVCGAGIAIVALTMLELSIPQLLALVALANIVVAIFIFRQVPEITVQLVVWIVSHTLYRVRGSGLEHLPEHGAALLICSRATSMDPVLVAGALERPVRLVLAAAEYDKPWLGYVYRVGGAIRVDSMDPQTAITKTGEALARGEVLALFAGFDSEQDSDSPKEDGADQLGALAMRMHGETKAPLFPLVLDTTGESDEGESSGRGLRKLFRVVCQAPVAPREAKPETKPTTQAPLDS